MNLETRTEVFRLALKVVPDPAQLYFWRTAVQAVIRGRWTAACSYIHAKTLPPGAELSLFEYAQGLMEKKLEELDHLLEPQSLQHVVEGDANAADGKSQHDRFLEWRASVIALTQVS